MTNRSPSPALIIDPDLQSFLPALQPHERTALREQLLAEGCRDALLVWQTDAGMVLIDGHHRYAICQEEGLPYPIDMVRGLTTRDDVLDWMYKHQDARRNWTEEQRSYVRGKQYAHTKLDQGRPPANVARVATLIRTEKQLAAEHEVSPRTIRNDAQFAAAVDTVAETVSPEAKRAILAGKVPLPRSDIIAVAQAAPEEQQRVLAITDKRAILAAAKEIKEQQAVERRQDRDSDLTDQERKAREDERRWREDGEFGRVIQRLYVVAHSTSAEHAAEVMIEFGLARVFIQSTLDQMEEGAAWLRDCSCALRQHLGTQTPLRKVE